MPYLLFVDDNFHYMDEEERTGPQRFETAEEALEEARKIVDACLASMTKPGIRADELYELYVGFGDDPFIRNQDAPPVEFSAWSYAKMRCGELCPDTR